MPHDKSGYGRFVGVAVLLMLCVHAALIAWSALRHSPTYSEMGHLPAGLRVWQKGRFDLYTVNPPLLKIVAAAPVACLKPKTDWGPVEHGVPRPKSWVGERYVAMNGACTFRHFIVARWACIPLSLLGAYVCYRWGRELYGAGAGGVACALWCFSPNILGHGSLITPDVPAAALGALAGYLFWRWLRHPSWRATLLSGLGLGLAECTKFTWVVLFALWPLVWLACLVGRRRGLDRSTVVRQAIMLLVVMALAVYVINLCYGFEASFRKLGEYRFVSDTLGGDRTGGRLGHHRPSNRFADSWLALAPVPLPQNYVAGIDIQKRDFEVGKFCFLRGQWQGGGWWYYYLYAMAIKVPLGTWGLAALALALTFLVGNYSPSWRDELVLLAPGVVVFLVVSSQTRLTIHSRYVIPALPFLFIWTSKVAQVLTMRASARWPPAMATMVIFGLAWSVASSLAVYPHSLSYFNELVGGPRHGGEHLLDSNIDWGQDLLYLKEWLDANPDVKLDGLAYFGSYPAELMGIPQTPYPAPWPDSECHDADCSVNGVEPEPGWYALSVNSLYQRTKRYRHFLLLKPVAAGGYSIFIYHVTPHETNRVRRELGLR